MRVICDVCAPAGQSYLSGVWSAFDTDKNGLLDYEEFKLFMAVTRTPIRHS